MQRISPSSHKGNQTKVTSMADPTLDSWGWEHRGECLPGHLDGDIEGNDFSGIWMGGDIEGNVFPDIWIGGDIEGNVFLDILMGGDIEGNAFLGIWMGGAIEKNVFPGIWIGGDIYREECLPKHLDRWGC